MRDGMLAASVAIGLEALKKTFEIEVAELTGHTGRHNPGRSHMRYGQDNRSVVPSGCAAKYGCPGSAPLTVGARQPCNPTSWPASGASWSNMGSVSCSRDCPPAATPLREVDRMGSMMVPSGPADSMAPSWCTSRRRSRQASMAAFLAMRVRIKASQHTSVWAQMRRLSGGLPVDLGDHRQMVRHSSAAPRGAGRVSVEV